MAGRVSLQADVGTLGIRGLAAFAPLLEAFSMDNVAPSAVIQMEALGASFLISGPYASSLPQYLQRQSHTPIGRMALHIGWRKGDTAAIMAGSAGGQAMALLCLCLFSLYRSADAGTILSRLSFSLLPGDMATSSVAQLVDVGELLKAKSAALGFGNELARQALRIHEAYNHLGLPVPNDLLALITAHSMVELLEYISKALRDPTKLVRIRGTCGLGQVLAVLTTMFPHDTIVTIQGLIVHEGPRKCIILAIDNEYGPGSHFGLETHLSNPTEPLRDLKMKPNPEILKGQCSFVWKNWIAEWLQLQFLTFGLTCPVELLVACSNILVHIPGLLTWDSHGGISSRRQYSQIYSLLNIEDQSHLHIYGLLNIDDPSHLQRIYHCSRSVLGVEPSGAQTPLTELYKELANVGSVALSSLDCSCQRSCNFYKGWDPPQSTWHIMRCKKRKLWNIIGDALDYLVWSLLIVPSNNATVQSPVQSPRKGGRIAHLLNESLNLSEDHLSAYRQAVHASVIELFAPFSKRWSLAASSGATTVFPARLRDLEWQENQVPSYELHDGQILFSDHYYRELRSESTSSRRLASRSLIATSTQATAAQSMETSTTNAYLTSFGCHSDILISIREGLDFLQLRTSIKVSGESISVNLLDILISSLGLRELDCCEHPVSTPVSLATQDSLISTSVASPVPNADSGKISIVQTRHNPTARLLACSRGVGIYFLKDCCLNCSVVKAKEQSTGMERAIIIII